MHCYQYFIEHLSSRNIKLVILTDDPDFQNKAKIDDNSGQIFVASGEEYVSTLTEQFKGLEDKLCRIPYNEDEGWRSYHYHLTSLSKI